MPTSAPACNTDTDTVPTCAQSSTKRDGFLPVLPPWQDQGTRQRGAIGWRPGPHKQHRTMRLREQRHTFDCCPVVSFLPGRINRPPKDRVRVYRCPKQSVVHEVLAAEALAGGRRGRLGSGRPQRRNAAWREPQPLRIRVCSPSSRPQGRHDGKDEVRCRIEVALSSLPPPASFVGRGGIYTCGAAPAVTGRCRAVGRAYGPSLTHARPSSSPPSCAGWTGRLAHTVGHFPSSRRSGLPFFFFLPAAGFGRTQTTARGLTRTQ
jgi:hypothetical protein